VTLPANDARSVIRIGVGKSGLRRRRQNVGLLILSHRQTSMSRSRGGSAGGGVGAVDSRGRSAAFIVVDSRGATRWPESSLASVLTDTVDFVGVRTRTPLAQVSVRSGRSRLCGIVSMRCVSARFAAFTVESPVERVPLARPD